MIDLFPGFKSHQHHMARTNLIHQIHFDSLCGVMIDKPELFLHTAAFHIAVIVAAPDTLHTEIQKGVTEHFTGSLGNESLSPKWFTYPVSKLVFVGKFRKIGTVKSNTADRLAVFLQANRICFGSGKYIADDLTAVLNACVGLPSRRRTYLGIAGIFIEFFRIILTPRTENKTFGLKCLFGNLRIFLGLLCYLLL